MSRANASSSANSSFDERSVTRRIVFPDELRLARCAAAPQYGPRLLFFSGGTALNGVARRLTAYSHNSIHLTTAFDSGGSSGRLREAFHVPAVGDLRSRLMALADRTVRGQGPVVELFAYRFAKDSPQEALHQRLKQMVDGRDPLLERVARPMRDLIARHLGYFAQQMPCDFDLRGASIGNLVLVGGYLHNGRDLETVLFLFSKLAGVQGIVHPTVDSNVHLAATLADGTRVIGQHQLCGKEAAPIRSPVTRVELVSGLHAPQSVQVAIHQKVAAWITAADVICYPMGSFYSSVIVNLLPAGVAPAIAANTCPKVFIPNTGVDPEQLGMSIADCVESIHEYLASRCDRHTSIRDFVQFVLLHKDATAYESAPDLAALRRIGVEPIEVPLVSESSKPLLDAEMLVRTLVSFT